MFEFLSQKMFVKSAQKYIEKLDPKVNVYVPKDYPMSMLKDLRKKCVVISKINSFELEYERLDDTQLKGKTKQFKEGYLAAIDKGKKEIEVFKKTLNQAKNYDEREIASIAVEEAEEKLEHTKKTYLLTILPEAFAVVREAGKRVLNMRHYDVQLLGGQVLNDGNIAEMTTGEGKTLVSTLPAYLNALTGEGVHIVTVNDYLACRDRDWMGPLHEFLGLKVGVIVHDIDPDQRKKEYACDVVYGTNNEFGFDYLRDNMVNTKEDMTQNLHYFSIVDEVDSILVDEARTPLIISGPAEQATDQYYKAFDVASSLKGRRITENDEIDAKHQKVDLSEGYDYLADEKVKTITLSESGETKAAQLFGVENLHDIATVGVRHHVLSALRAKEFFKKDVDYVVKDGEVIIVDEFTGRMMSGRRWSDGLHQAVEAKERIKIARENQTLATITFQNYFRMYEKLSGMTGTAMTEANEFKQIYNLDCTVIPTNKPLQRKNYPDAVYRSDKEKNKAVIDQIEACYKKGQPVLVGTISIEKSELFGRMLTQKGVAHKVLNAKFHDQEAPIIAQAGRLGAVTIATNMAGRGTDIVLGGNAEMLAKVVAMQNMKGKKNKEEFDILVADLTEKFKKETDIEQKKVLEAGGLYVLGTERHESRRIDNQLRGRQGRQGDPGASRFFVSLDDDLMRLFASDKIISVMDKLGMEEGQVLEHPWLSRAIETAQKRVETHNFEMRKHLLEYDDVMNRQREVLYDLRKEVLENEDIKDLIIGSIEDVAIAGVQQYMSVVDDNEHWDQEGMIAYFEGKFGYKFSKTEEELWAITQEDLTHLAVEGLRECYQRKEDAMDSVALRHIERILMMHVIDTKWKYHLHSMDQLKDSVGLRSYGQKDPLIEYKHEGFEMFQLMHNSVYIEVAESVFKIQAQPQHTDMKVKGVFDSVPKKMFHGDIADVQEGKNSYKSEMVRSAESSRVVNEPIVNREFKIGRNDPCTCGSGKKYKKCCGS